MTDQLSDASQTVINNAARPLYPLAKKFTMFRAKDEGYTMARLIMRNEATRFAVAVGERLDAGKTLPPSWVERKLRTKKMNGSTMSDLVHDWCRALVAEIKKAA